MSAFSRFRAIVPCLLSACALMIWAGAASAQVTPSGASDAKDTSPLELFRQRIQSTGASASVPMEGAVDPDEYVVGPGDVFGVSISGIESVSAAVPVAADGNLVLPDAGVVPVAGLTLAAAIDRSMAALRDRFENVDVTVSLASPRQFYVHVVGAVTAPGRYVVLPVSRVSDALALAYMDTTRTPVGNPDFRPSLRNVTVYRRDGTEVAADLMAYLAAGVKELNPYLQDGDVVSVPAYNPDLQSVSISGNVPFPGTYDFRPGETVRDLVAVASGIRPQALQGSVRLSRTVGGTMRESVVDLADSVAKKVTLHARDQVFVLPEKHARGFAHVEGRVRFPGTYPIEQGVTTVAELVEMAGGYQEDALLRGAYLIRNRPDRESRIAGLTGESGNRPPGSALEEPPDLFWSPYLLTAPSGSALQALRLSDLDFLNRIYLAQELRLQNRVSLDLDTESGGSLLADGDRLVIPRDDGTVFVFGQVNRAGFVAFREGWTTGDYIRDAGGLGENAGDTHVIQAGTQKHISATTGTIRSGDMIFVSRKEEVADFAELERLILENKRAKAESRSRIVTGVLQAVSTVGTIVALIVTLRRN